MNKYLDVLLASLDAGFDKYYTEVYDSIVDIFCKETSGFTNLSEADHFELLKRGLNLYCWSENPKIEIISKYEDSFDFIAFSDCGNLNKEIFLKFRNKLDIEGVVKFNKSYNEDMKEIIEEYKLLMEII